VEILLEDWIGTTPDARQWIRVGTRLLAALVVGAVIGYERERIGKAAGLRTHMLVAMGTALIVIACVESGMGDDALSRVIQGLVTGIGFLGAGTILKRIEEREIQGLTTAAGIWMTAAASAAVGLGQIVIALIGTVLAWVVLSVLARLTNGHEPPASAPGKRPAGGAASPGDEPGGDR
jgi:putative Mg2+ transporter-C (MgtC) family protein